MISKIKAIGLAVVAVAAMSAFAVPAAQAAKLDIGVTPASVFAHSEAGQVHALTLTSTSGSKFTTSCPTASLEGTTQGQSIEEATVTATYSGNTEVPNCTAFGTTSQVLMNGCKYTITGSGQPSGTALVDVTGCTEGKSIEIKTAICTLDIVQQNGLSHIVGTKLSASEVTLAATVTNITVRQTGIACPDGNNHLGFGGSFTGNTIGKARVDVGGTQVTKHSHQYSELSQGGALSTLELT